MSSTRPVAPTMTPEALLPKVAHGDAAAVSACIARYGGLVYGLARRFLGHEADAEDATQEIFLALWQSAGRYDAQQAAESTFVTMIARRRLIDRRRRSARRPSPQPLPDELPADATGVSDQLETRDDAAVVLGVLAELRDDQRRMIQMAVLDGLTHDEIAAGTGVPLGTVKTHIRRGLIRVREKLIEKRKLGGAP